MDFKATVNEWYCLVNLKVIVHLEHFPDVIWLILDVKSLHIDESAF